MSTAKLLPKLGVLIIEDFIDATQRDGLCLEMLKAEKREAATYSEASANESIDRDIRKTQYCDISSLSRKKITKKVKQLKPALESFFNTELSDSFEPPKFLLYRKGDFFAPHTDDQLNRKINISINLNEQSGEHSYEGGELQLYGLLKGENFVKRGIAAPTKAGTLIAYPVDIVHEVTPILKGARMTIVSRFLSC